jgi:hypothetical protein
MAEWHPEKDKYIMLDEDFDNLHNFFLSGKATKMYQLVKKSPTKVAKLLGLNYGSYIAKLRNPEKFTVMHINLLAYAINIDPDKIHNIIQKELTVQIEGLFEKFEDNIKK